MPDRVISSPKSASLWADAHTSEPGRFVSGHGFSRAVHRPENFRERLDIFLESSGPIAITRHGETIGSYIPARPGRKEEQLAALRKAAKRLDGLIAGSGATEEDLVSDFKESRRRRRKVPR